MPTKRVYVFRSKITCSLCQRKMEGATRRKDTTYYRCNASMLVPGSTTALAHPSQVYLREDLVTPAVNRWIGQLFDPVNRNETVKALLAADDSGERHFRRVAEQRDRIAAEVAMERLRRALAKALPALADLPPGFSVEKDDGGDDSGVTVSSKDARCAKLVAFSNADTPPGSKASAGQSYSGGAQGPFIDESIDAMGSPAAVRALQKSFKQAVAACRTMTLKVPGEGSSPISVREVSAPQAGTDPVAVRFIATSGPWRALRSPWSPPASTTSSWPPP